MANQYGLVVQGDDEANTLEAYAVGNNSNGKDFFNIVHAAGGNDKITVDSWLAGMNVGVEIYGEDGNDTIFDSKNKDTLSGGNGDDKIHSSNGKDVIDGGGGTDTLYVTSANLDDLTISGIERLVIASGVHIGSFDINSLEEIGRDRFYRQTNVFFDHQATLTDPLFIGGPYFLHGSDFDDQFDVSTSTATFEIDGKGGSDTILGGLNKATLDGGVGDDSITGGAQADKLIGGTGKDTIHGGGGNDAISAGSGNDLVFAGDGKDVIGGRDVIASDVKHLYGEAGDDTFEGFKSGSAAEVHLSGGRGNDTLEFQGKVGNLQVEDIETLELEPHVENDFEVKASITATVDFLNSFKHITTTGGNPLDITLSSDGKFTWKDAGDHAFGEIHGWKQDDEIDLSKAGGGWTLYGGNGDDVLKLGVGGYVYGGDGDDVIIGGTSYDYIDGGSGDDIINGRGGSDELTGNGGSDTFVFQAGCGHDSVYSFETGKKVHDIIDLSAIKSIKNYDDLVDHHISSNGTLTIDLGGGDKVYVYGLYEQNLDASFFTF